MRVGLTAWENRISPVFDVARTLLIVEIEDRRIVTRRYESIRPEKFFQLAEALKGIDVLICGAISKLPADIIERSGIKLISFIGGDVEEVLLSYVEGRQITPAFSMPGCGGQCRKQMRSCIRIKGKEDIMPNKDGTGPQGQGNQGGRGRGGCNKGGGGSGKGQGQGQGQGRGTGGNKGGKGKGQGRGN